MKKFKSKTHSKMETLIIIIVIGTVCLLNYYNKKISKSLIDVSSTKLEEITNIYVKKDIVPKGYDINNLIKINKNNNGEILYVDVDTENANIIMVDVVKKIQDSINQMSFKDKTLKRYKDNIYIEVPLFFTKGTLLANLGPTVPVKLNFYEQVLASIDTELINYGINNALLKVYLTIDLEQKIYVPYKEQKFKRQYKLLLSAKMINGTVPNILGGKITSTEVLNPS